MKNFFIIIVSIVLFVGVMFMFTYNNLVTLREGINQSLGEIETQLQRRNDLIPNLIATVKGYAEHEEQLFTTIADARSKLASSISSNDITAIDEANQILESSLGRLIAIAESYPDLKASEQFIALQDELAGTENRIAYARSKYNESVASFNSAILRFPSSIVANMNGYTTIPYFRASENAHEVPQVVF